VECGEEVQGDRSVLGRAMGMHFHGSRIGRLAKNRRMRKGMYRGNADLWEVPLQRISLLLLY
jgi:hypothetical protein